MKCLSVCIIARNEEHKIERCLQSVINSLPGCEIIIVDTGSQDSTKDLALRYTEKVFDFLWVDDFSAARSYSIEKAQNEWILILDCDEWIICWDKESFEDFCRNEKNLGMIRLCDDVGDMKHHEVTNKAVTRLFHRDHYRFEGVIHEQIVSINAAEENQLKLVNITVGHDGYLLDEEERSKKADRNILLLREEIKKMPDNSYLLYQLGKSYQLKEDYKSAAVYFELCLESAYDTKLEYVRNTVMNYGIVLLADGNYEKALELTCLIDDFNDTAEFAFLWGMIYEHNGRYRDAIEMYIKSTRFEMAAEEGINNYKAYYKSACILIKLKEYELAVKMLLQCGNYEPAQKMLEQIDYEQY